MQPCKTRTLDQCGRNDLFSSRVVARGALEGLAAGDFPHSSGRMEKLVFGGSAVRLCLDSLTLLASVENPPEPEPVKAPAAAAAVEAAKPEWDVRKSVFMPRTRRSDARSMFQTDKVVARALRRDWAKLLDEDRFWKFVRTHDDDASSRSDVEAELKEVQRAFAPHYATLLAAFSYYGGVLGSENPALSFMVGENDTMKFAYECGLIGADDPDGDEFVSEVFVLVNVHIGDASAKAHQRALNRVEFLEALCRIAVWKCRDRPELVDLSEMIDRVLKEVVPKIPKEATYASTLFRKERCVTEDTDTALRAHLPVLKALYAHYSDALHGGVLLSGFLQLVEDSGLARSSLWDFSDRDACFAFASAKDLVVDDVRSRGRAISLTFEDFMEALLFVAEYLPLPTESDLIKHGLTKNNRPVDCYMVLFDLQHSSDEEPAAQRATLEPPRRPYGPMSANDWAALTARPMSELFNHFIRLLAGKLAVKGNGRLTHPGFNFVRAGYLTEAILEGLR